MTCRKLTLKLLVEKTKPLRARVRALVAQLRPTHGQVRELADTIADEIDEAVPLPAPFEALDGPFLRVLIRWLLHEAIARLDGVLGWDAYQASADPADLPPPLSAIRADVPDFVFRPGRAPLAHVGNAAATTPGRKRPRRTS